jgi:hypothetical protein
MDWGMYGKRIEILKQAIPSADLFVHARDLFTGANPPEVRQGHERRLTVSCQHDYKETGPPTLQECI